MAHQIVWEKDGFYCNYSGQVSFQDFMEVFALVNANPRFDTAKYAIFDFLGVTSHTITQSQAEEMAGLHYAQDLSNCRLHRATIATDSSHIALLRAWAAALPNPEKVTLCSSPEEARAWVARCTGVQSALEPAGARSK